MAEKLLHSSSLPTRTLSLSSSERRTRNTNSTSGLNVSFEVMEELEDCKDQEVGSDFFSKGKKEKKQTPFKKMLSFGKGKKKRSSSSGEQTLAAVTPRARQPEVRNMEGRVSIEDFKHSPHFSVERPGSRPGSLSSPLLLHRSRDNSGASSSSHSSGAASSSAHSRHSTHSGTHSTDNQLADNSRNSASIHSGEFASPVNVSPIGELDIESEINNIDNRHTFDFDIKSEHNSNSSIIYPGEEVPDNDIANDNSRKSSKGFYDDIGVFINFNELPVAKEPILDLTNETIIDLDGDIIKDQEELKVLRGKSLPVVVNDRKTQPTDQIILDNDRKTQPTEQIIVDNDRMNQNDNIFEKKDDLQILRRDSPLQKKKLERIMDSNLTAKVNSELRINFECNMMVQEIERIGSPSLLNKTRDNVDIISSPNRMKKTPSPTFSEIDALLGNITAELDNLEF